MKIRAALLAAAAAAVATAQLPPGEIFYWRYPM
jgi:hypothetical protein